MPLDSPRGESANWPPNQQPPQGPEADAPHMRPEAQQPPQQTQPPRRAPVPGHSQQPGIRKVYVNQQRPAGPAQPKTVIIGRMPQPQQRPVAAPGYHSSKAETEAISEHRVSKRAGRIAVGVLVVCSLTAAAAAGDFLMNQSKIMASLNIADGPKAPDSNTNYVGEAPTIPADEETTAVPTPTATATTKTTAPSPTTKMVPIAPIVPSAANCLDNMPADLLIAQKIVAPIHGDQPGPAGSNLVEMAKVFNEMHIGGAILMTSPTDINDGSILAFKKAQTVPIEVSVDQEAGDVTDKTKKWPVARIQVPKSKLQPNGYMPTAAAMAKMTPAQITAIVSENYSQLNKMGIDKSYGVVVDLAPVKSASVLGADRVVSSDPAVVAKYAQAYIAGADKAGVGAVIKHWGMGSASKNTDNAPALVPHYDTLKARDFKVYDILRAAGVKVDAMIGSEYIPGLTITAGKDKKLGTTDDVKISASMSPAAVAEFKADLADKNAVTVTDDLGAPAISGAYKVDKASVAAWKAGIDQALFVITSDKMSVKAQLTQTITSGVAALKSGELNRNEAEASVARILGAKSVDACTVLKKIDAKAYAAAQKAAAAKPAPATRPKPQLTPTVTTTVAPKPTSTTVLPARVTATTTKK